MKTTIANYLKSIKSYLKTIFYKFFDIALSISIISNLLIITLSLLFCASDISFAQSSFQGKRLEEAIINYVKQNNKCDCEVEIKQSINEIIKFDETGVKASINHKNELTGICKVSLEFMYNGKIIGSKDVKINVKLFAKVPVAARSIAKGQKITKEDIILKKTEVTKIDPNSVIEIPDAINKQASKNIERNQVILYSDIGITDSFDNSKEIFEIPNSNISIKKGEKINILYYAGGIRIATKGFALENGTAGSVIKVKTNDKTLIGFIADDGNVIVDDKQNLTLKN